MLGNFKGRVLAVRYTYDLVIGISHYPHERGICQQLVVAVRQEIPAIVYIS